MLVPVALQEILDSRTNLPNELYKAKTRLAAVHDKEKMAAGHTAVSYNTGTRLQGSVPLH